jgi:hypothetical protein
MAVTPDLALVIDELVLEGVRPDDPLVQASLAHAVAPALEAHGLERASGPVTTAVAEAVAREAPR